MAASEPRPEAGTIAAADPNELPPALSTRGISKKRPPKEVNTMVNSAPNARLAAGNKDGNGTRIDEVAWLIAGLKATIESLKDEQRNTQRSVDDQAVALKEEVKALRNEVETLKEEVGTLRTQLAAATVSQPAAATISQPSGNPSYAEVARTTPSSQPTNLRTLSSMSSTPSGFTDTLYCTIDTSRVGEEDKDRTQLGAIRRAIENEIRTGEGRENWRCVAVVKDPRNVDRIRVIARNETELQLVKEAAQKTALPGVRVFRDQLYPVKIDNINREAVIDAAGNILPGAAEVLGEENEVTIAQMIWLSRKDTDKTHGSMVIYVTKSSDAEKLLREQYFHAAGESAYTRIYVRQEGPVQCYNCQELGHKAFSCRKPQVCAICADQGHYHKECHGRVPKCVPCGGPHESFSKNCRVRHPRPNA